MHKADSVDDEAADEKIAATLNIDNADSEQYHSNSKTLKAWSTVMKNSNSNDATTAELKATDASRYYDAAMKELIKADKATRVNEKQAALDNAKQYFEYAMQKQQDARDMLLKVNPDLKNVTPENVPVATVNQPSNPTPVAVNNPTQPNPTPTNPNPTVTPHNNGQPSNPVAVNNPRNNPTVQPEDNGTPTIAVVGDIKESPGSPYSVKHPIPINPKLPEGLIFKVQIGAFAKPIAQNAFKGLQPLAGETTANGMTRYTAGTFTEFVKAKGALNKVKDMGYKDAFIVAFYNGKRITLKDASGIQNGTQPAPSVTQPVAVNNPSNPSTPDTGKHLQATPVVSTPVTDVKGIFYTVQVGAFKTDVTSDKLFNLSPLFSYHASNGYIRYNCGIYSSVAKASDAKNAIINKTPIKDAFVVAYYNGERIPVTQAAQMLSNGTAKLSENPKLDIVPAGTTNNGGSNNTPSTNQPSAPVNTQPSAPINNNPTPPVHTNPSDTSSKVIFSVQVGEYTGDIPVSVANNLLKIASQGITTHKEDNGTTSYTVGSYHDAASASMLKQELIDDGFPGCFVVAYHKGKKITLQEAQTLLNK